MPSVKHKSGELESGVDEREDDISPDENGELLTALVEKVEQLDQRLKSLREPLEHLMTGKTNLEVRLDAVEQVALKLDLGTAPKIASDLYASLQPKDIFLSVLTGILQTLVTQYPQAMITDKPGLRRRYLMDAIDLAKQSVEIAIERLPKLAE